MVYLLLIQMISVAILAYLLWRAPEGWQDENGFHFGREPDRQISERDNCETQHDPMELARDMSSCEQAARSGHSPKVPSTAA